MSTRLSKVTTRYVRETKLPEDRQLAFGAGDRPSFAQNPMYSLHCLSVGTVTEYNTA